MVFLPVNPMRDNQDFPQLQQASIETAAIAGLISLDTKLNGGSFSNAEVISRSTLGGIALYSIYQSLLTALRTEALRKKGLISRETQRKMLIKSILESLRNGTSIGFSVGLTLLIFPWLTLPLSVLGLIGISKASIDLFDAFWEGLDQNQQTHLLLASKEAGINLRRLINNRPYNFKLNN